MKKKLMILDRRCCWCSGGAYKFVLAKPAAEAKPKVEGTVYVLGKEFLVNLERRPLRQAQRRRWCSSTSARPPSPTAATRRATPPEGFGTMRAGGRGARRHHRRR